MDPALEIKEKKTMKRPKNRAPSKKREGKVLRVLLSGRCLPRSSSDYQYNGDVEGRDRDFKGRKRPMEG